MEGGKVFQRILSGRVILCFKPLFPESLKTRESGAFKKRVIFLQQLCRYAWSFRPLQESSCHPGPVATVHSAVDQGLGIHIRSAGWGFPLSQMMSPVIASPRAGAVGTRPALCAQIIIPGLLCPRAKSPAFTPPPGIPPDSLTFFSTKAGTHGDG